MEQEEMRKYLPDYSTVQTFYRYSEKGITLEQERIEQLHSESQRIVTVLIDLCKSALPFAEKFGMAFPTFKAKDASELSTYISPYLKADGEYAYTLLETKSPSDFLLLCWRFRDYVYAIFCGRDEFRGSYSLDTYDLKTHLPTFRPRQINRQLSINRLYQKSFLRYYNILEFCSHLIDLSKKEKVQLRIFSQKRLLSIILATKDKITAASFNYLKPQYDQRIDLSDAQNAFPKSVDLVKKESLFISYAREDKWFVDKLLTDLKSRNLHIWVDIAEIKVGESVIGKINEALKRSSFMCVVLSPNSANSNWVQRELSAALVKELDENSVVILPILLEDCVVPPLVKDKRYADFRKDYQLGLQELLSCIDAYSVKATS